MVTMSEAFVKFWKNYVNFTGRATRSEYWWFVLWSLIIGIVWAIMTLIIAVTTLEPGVTLSAVLLGMTDQISMVLAIWYMMSFFMLLSIIIPSLSLQVRRYRDMGLKEPVVWVLLLVTQCAAMISVILFNRNRLWAVPLMLSIWPTNQLAKVPWLGRDAK